MYKIHFEVYSLNHLVVIRPVNSKIPPFWQCPDCAKKDINIYFCIIVANRVLTICCFEGKILWNHMATSQENKENEAVPTWMIWTLPAIISQHSVTPHPPYLPTCRHVISRFLSSKQHLVRIRFALIMQKWKLMLMSFLRNLDGNSSKKVF